MALLDYLHKSLEADIKQRAYPCKVAGIPLTSEFDMHRLTFSFTFANPTTPIGARETEIYLPSRR